MSKRIAVLSDTHGLLRPEVLSAVSGCDAVIHSGDINKPEIIERLQEIPSHYRADSGLSPYRTCAHRAHDTKPPVSN